MLMEKQKGEAQRPGSGAAPEGAAPEGGAEGGGGGQKCGRRQAWGPSAGPGISVLLLTRSLGRHTVRPSGRPGFASSFKDNLATGRPEDQMA